ncbi:hypothetical protein C8R46DRAFT_1356872 [Mycena filopes]|nr:hypothetical protein C8R46DRAFT_1356872 [Mycena filopes]
MSAEISAPQNRSNFLVGDVVLLILKFCDISSIVAMSQSSKYLHQLASSKTVWLSAVKDLLRRGFIDLAPGEELNDLSKEELVEKVMRAVHGPRTWGSDHLLPAVVSREIILREGEGAHVHDQVKLLGGGDYLFHKHESMLECWNLVEERKVWTHEGIDDLEGIEVVDFAVARTEVPGQVVILTCLTLDGTPFTEDNYLEIMTLDLEAGASESVLMLSLPECDGIPGHLETPFAHAQICGDIAAVAFGADVWLLNWRAKTRVTMDMQSDIERFPHQCRLALAPGYAIVMLDLEDSDDPTTETITVCALAPLPWTPVHTPPTFPSTSAATTLHKLHSTPLPPFGPDGDPMTAAEIRMSVHESPIRRDLFRVWVHLAAWGESDELLLRYELYLGAYTLALAASLHHTYEGARYRQSPSRFREPGTRRGSVRGACPAIQVLEWLVADGAAGFAGDGELEDSVRAVTGPGYGSNASISAYSGAFKLSLTKTKLWLYATIGSWVLHLITQGLSGSRSSLNRMSTAEDL